MRGVAMVVLSLACAGRGANGPRTTSGPCWPIVPLSFQALEHGSEWEPIVELRADGTVHRVKRGAFARIANDHVQLEKGGLTCDASHVVHMDNTTETAHYDQDDVLYIDPMRIEVRDSGEVVMTHAGKSLHARVVGDHAAAKRTAALLALLALVGPPG